MSKNQGQALLNEVLQRYQPHPQRVTVAIGDVLKRAGYAVPPWIRAEAAFPDYHAIQSGFAPLLVRLYTQLGQEANKHSAQEEATWRDFARETRIKFLGLSDKETAKFLLDLEKKLASKTGANNG